MFSSRIASCTQEKQACCMVHLCACLIGRDFVSPGINNPDRWLFAAYGVVE